VSRRAYLLIAAGLAALAVASVVFATRVNPRRVAGGDADVTGSPVRNGAPALQARGWLNSPPLSPSDLRGKVVLYDFWTYSCVNCVRTLPHIRSWYERYAQDGLVVIGVHSPEFDFEKDHGNVAKAVQKLRVEWPVALDDDHHIWDRFANQYWPAKYLFGRDNRLQFVHFGEGDYSHTEDVIRRLLGVNRQAPRAGDIGSEPDLALVTTRETYLGAERGAEALASPEPLTAGEHDFTVPDPVPTDHTALRGRWLVDSEFVESVASDDALVLSYRAREVNLVMAPARPGQAIDVGVELDGRRLPTAHVADSDLYRLVLTPKLEAHVVRLTPSAPGLRMYAFTFGP